MVQGSSEQVWDQVPWRGQRGLCGCWVLQRCCWWKDQCGPSRKGGPARPFLVPGLGRKGARAGTKWKVSAQDQGLLLHRAPASSNPSPSPRQVPFHLCEGHCPGPQSDPSWPEPGYKVPQCLLVHRSSSVHPFCPRRPVHAAGLRENPTRPLQWCRAPPPFGWCRIANSV